MYSSSCRIIVAAIAWYLITLLCKNSWILVWNTNYFLITVRHILLVFIPLQITALSPKWLSSVNKSHSPVLRFTMTQSGLLRYREMFSDVSGTQMCYVLPWCFLTMLNLELWKLGITRLELRETSRHLWRVQGWSGYCWWQNKGAESWIFVTSLELLDQASPGFRTSFRSLIWNNYFIFQF